MFLVWELFCYIYSKTNIKFKLIIVRHFSFLLCSINLQKLTPAHHNLTPVRHTLIPVCHTLIPVRPGEPGGPGTIFFNGRDTGGVQKVLIDNMGLPARPAMKTDCSRFDIHTSGTSSWKHVLGAQGIRTDYVCIKSWKIAASCP